MKRLLASGLLLGVAVLAIPGLLAADAKDKDKAKEGLQALQEFIGDWKGNGGPDKPKPGPKDPLWKESVKWGWKFKGDDSWLTVEFKDSKVFKSGEMRYLVDKKKYQFTAVGLDDKKLVYEGELKDGLLTLERDDDKMVTHQIQMNTAADGVRFIYRTARKEGTTIYKDMVVAATKEGEALGATEKKNICVVSGGRGTTMVSYKGENFWVCCSGCAEAFKENPEKYIAEFKAKQGKK
jgi:hypothetical protein